MSKPASKTRSRVSNGAHLFVDYGNGHGAWARRFKDIYTDLIDDLGGIDKLSAGQIQLCRRAATLSVFAEKIEGQLASGNIDATFDQDQYGRLADRLARTLEKLGIERVPDQGMSISSILRADRASARP